MTGLMIAVWVAAAVLTGAPARALDAVGFGVAGGNGALRDTLIAASQVAARQREGITDARELFGAALSDYRTLLEALYAEGHYRGVVQIRVNGREAADYTLLEVPAQIARIDIAIDPGPPFAFGKIAIGPIAGGTNLPEGLRQGERARSGTIRRAVSATIDGWRAAGHPKARVVQQRVTADHARSRVDISVRIEPGPTAVFGELVLSGDSAVRPDRIRRIAGLPSGEPYSPATLDLVAARLRRDGAFGSVALSDAPEVGPDGRIDILATLTDLTPRRYGFGAELSSFDGLRLSGFWLHRNWRGGGERLRIEAEAAGIGGQSSGIDYSLGARLERPAAFGADTKTFVLTELEKLDEPTYQSDRISIGVGAERIFSPTFKAELGVTVTNSKTRDDLGQRNFTLIGLPGKAQWDRRDSALNPTTGFYLGAEGTPFTQLDGSAAGVRALLDGRAYRQFGSQRPVILAGRVQLGTVIGTELTSTPPEFLFTSGGGGTVRGQPYQSLDVDLGGGVHIGGRSFVGLSGEVRAQIKGPWGAVAFWDAGYIGRESLIDGSGAWHAGAGVGVRYNTGLGPIRLDIAAPVSGTTGSGVQLYIGIGQAF